MLSAFKKKQTKNPYDIVYADTRELVPIELVSAEDLKNKSYLGRKIGKRKNLQMQDQRKKNRKIYVYEDTQKLVSAKELEAKKSTPFIANKRQYEGYAVGGKKIINIESLKNKKQKKSNKKKKQVADLKKKLELPVDQQILNRINKIEILKEEVQKLENAVAVFLKMKIDHSLTCNPNKLILDKNNQIKILQEEIQELEHNQSSPTIAPSASSSSAYSSSSSVYAGNFHLFAPTTNSVPEPLTPLTPTLENLFAPY